MIEKKKDILINIILFFTILGLTYVYSKTHMEHDSIYDFRMRFPKLSTMDVVLNYGNGRLLGNLSGIIMIQHPLIMSFVKALFTVGILELTNILFEFRWEERILFLLSVGIMLPGFFFQMFYYSSSFFVYIPPLFGILLILFIIEKMNKKYLTIPLVLILGFFNQLFVEHIALFSVVIAFALMIARDRKKRDLYVIWFLSSGLGFLFMLFFRMLFVKEALEMYHKMVTTWSMFVFNLGQMIVSVYLGNAIFGICLALFYAKWDSEKNGTKDLSGEAIKICLLLFLSTVNGMGTLLFSPFLFLEFNKKQKLITKDNFKYLFLFFLVYTATFVFLFVDFRGESMCLQFANYCESILLVLILKEKVGVKWETIGKIFGIKKQSN